ncbi:GNAT family N-acetyltransferase [Lactiplantibacillus plantarum]|nr:GNAT family N-acetyltransferase [Lactiplantibacillus plantarum]
MVINKDGQVVGVVVLTTLKTGVWEVKNIAVAPAYQHRGIAKALLATAIAVCQAAPTCDELQIGTGNSSLRQLAIYQHAGFEMIAVWVNFLWITIQTQSMKLACSVKVWCD